MVKRIGVGILSKADEIVGINYEQEYYKLKKVEAENEELKKVIINMSKFTYGTFESLDDVIRSIERNLKEIGRRR